MRKAKDDAVAAGQAEFAGDRGGLEWKVEGKIEIAEAETATDR